MPALEDYDISALSPLERKVLIIAATKLGNLRFYEKLPPNTNFNFTFTFQDGNMVTPLIMAATLGNLPLTKWLLDHGADINMLVVNGEEEMTALVMTAIKGNTVLTRLLLSYGACIEIPDAQYSVLDAAIVTHRHYPSVRILIEGGADLYSTNPRGSNPLFEACRKGSMEIASAMIENWDMDINQYVHSHRIGLKDVDRMTSLAAHALFETTVNCHHSLLHELLLQGKAIYYLEDIQKANSDYELLVDTIVRHDNTLLQQLIHCAMVNCNDQRLHSGMTALMMAAGLGDIEAAEILIYEGEASVLKRDKTGAVAWQYAANNSQLAMMKFLRRYQ